MTQNDNGPGPGRNYGEMAVFMFGRKVVFWPKIHFNPKKHQKILKRLIFILEKGWIIIYEKGLLSKGHQFICLILTIHRGLGDVFGQKMGL